MIGIQTGFVLEQESNRPADHRRCHGCSGHAEILPVDFVSRVGCRDAHILVDDLRDDVCSGGDEIRLRDPIFCLTVG